MTGHVHDHRKAVLLSSERGHSGERPPSVAEALLRKWPIAIAAIVCCTLAGVVWASTVPVRYVAEAQVIAGATSVTAAAVPSFAEAGNQLAETYSRVFAGDGVQSALEEAVDEESVELTASPIPGSSIIVIEARGASAEAATTAADAGVDALVSVVTSLLDNDADVQAATVDLNEANVRLGAAESALASAVEAEAAPETIASARAEVESARGLVEAYDALLSQVVVDSRASNGAERLASAEITSDTSRQRFELRVTASFIIGCVLGLVLAYAAAVSGARRPRRTGAGAQP